MTDDTISRAEAIDKAIMIPVARIVTEDKVLCRKAVFVEDIEALPSAQPRWIPCSTALPKEDGQYIVTVKYEHVDGYEDVYSEHGEWVDGHWDEFGHYHCGRVEKVLAWMPLPRPYHSKEGKE